MMKLIKKLFHRSLPIIQARFEANDLIATEAIPVIDSDIKCRFLTEYFDKIEGWNGPGAFRFLDSIDDIQKNQFGISGSVAEIGVHHGQFFTYLAMLRASGERAMACDVFEQQELNKDGSGCGDRAIFEQNLQRYLGSLNGIIIFSQSSDQLTKRDVISRIGQIRIISIDGGHWRDIVINDLCVAASCLHENGIVVLDDVFCEYWPGVTEGLTCYLWNAYERGAIQSRLPPQGKLVPFAVGCNKTLLCFEDKYPQWIALFEKFGPNDALQAKQLGWQERPILVYDFEIPDAGL
jgi:hypothetical protein